MKTLCAQLRSRARSHESRRGERWLRRLRALAHRRGFVPGIGLVTAVDSVLPACPTATLLVTVSMLRPERWRAAAFWFACGAAVGAGLLAMLVGLAGEPALESLLGEVEQSSAWRWAESAVRAHGAAVLFVLALAPWPVRTAILACAVAGLPWPQIAATVLAGRLLGFALVAKVAAQAPQHLPRWLRLGEASGAVTEPTPRADHCGFDSERR